MRQILALYRHAVAAGVVFLLIGVVALSTATRQPCLRAFGGLWHTCKAGRLTESEQHEGSVAEAAEPAEDVVVAEAEPSPAPHLAREETLPRTLPISSQTHHFRAPPPLQ